MTVVQLVASAFTAAASVIVVLGAIAVRAFAVKQPARLRLRPPVSVLKPLYGGEPMLEAALATFCVQSYPGLQIVFGVREADDLALDAVNAIRRRFPAADITVVVEAQLHGANRKISNLINMLPAARHDVLVLSDSDLHVPAEYIERIVAALEQPGVGLVTTLCTGLPTVPGMVSRLGATGITHSFLPGVLLSRALGRQDCLGTTMALRRDTLARAGGLPSLVGHVADDHVLAGCVRGIGMTTALASVVAKTAVPERRFGALVQHELRWARTIRGVEPGLFVMSALQFPLLWASVTVGFGGAAWWSLGVFAAAWAVRAGAALAVDRALGLSSTRQRVRFLLLPVRDVVSGLLVVASYLGDRVTWRGHVMHVRGEGGEPVMVPPALATDCAGVGGSRPAPGL